VIEINCSRHGGLRFAAGASGSQLLGVAVDRAGGNGITLRARSVTLDDDYIGLNLAGAAAGNRGDGVHVTAASSGDQIGRNRSGISGAVANVISANGGSGIVLAGSHGNTVAANRIGTNAAGTAAIGNAGNGIAIVGRSYGNEIGGTAFVDKATGRVNNPTGSKETVTPVFVVPPLGNLVSGNARSGVLIAAGASRNVLNGNFVGTTAKGDRAIGNAGDGVWIDGANGNSLIGCKFVNNPFVYYNVLSGNGGNGLRVTNANQTLVQGNFFGIGANNTTPVANRADGVLVEGSSANTQVGGVIPLGNVSAGNGRNGIEVTGRARGFTTFNTFGGLLAFKGAAPNRNDGLLITSTGGGNLARTNVFSGNARNGIEIGGNASGVTVDPDIVGLDTMGNAALPNRGDGVLIDGSAHNNVVGGSRRSVIAQNTFSGNGGYGLAITGRAYGNRLFSTFVGTEILGVSAVPNGRGGVLVGGTAQRNSIGSLLTRPANLISGNTGIGVTLRAGTRGNRVLNNYIGLNRFGRRLPNTVAPLVNRGRGNTILGNRF
jgi:parallel beta-helix repeat protein